MSASIVSHLQKILTMRSSDCAYGAKPALIFTLRSAQSFATFTTPVFFRPLWYELRLHQLAGFSSKKPKSICMKKRGPLVISSLNDVDLSTLEGKSRCPKAAPKRGDEQTTGSNGLILNSKSCFCNSFSFVGANHRTEKRKRNHFWHNIKMSKKCLFCAI